jgi:hypothetical protein
VEVHFDHLDHATRGDRNARRPGTSVNFTNVVYLGQLGNDRNSQQFGTFVASCLIQGVPVTLFEMPLILTKAPNILSIA